MSFHQRFLLLIFLPLALQCLGQKQPTLVVPSGFFMVSAGLSHNGDVVTLASGKLNVWNLDSLKLRYSVKFDTRESYNIHYSADGKYIIVSYTGYKTTIVDAATGKSLHFFDGWIQDILKKEISPDSRKIITTKNSAMVWDLETGKLLLELGKGGPDITYSSFDNSGSRIVTGDEDGTIKLWNAQTGSLMQTMKGNNSTIFYTCFSADDKFLATADYNRVSAIFETATGRLISSLAGHVARVNDLQFSHNNKYLLSASGNEAYLWQVDNGKKLVVMSGHAGEVLTCRFTENEDFVITSASDKTLRKWALPSGKQVSKVAFNGDYGNYSIYKNRLILCNQDRINIYTYPELKAEYSLLPLDSANYLVLDPLGRYDGTESARKLLYFKCGEEIIDLDQVKDQLWVPDLAPRINKRETINAKTISELNICDLTPLTKTISETSDRMQFGITPRRGGLGETILLVNNIEVRRYQPAALQKSGAGYILSVNKQELAGYFVSGQKNKIMVKSTTADNLFSSRGAIATSTDTINRQQTAPNLYAVMVGVSDYKGDDMDLKYAAKDANDISAAISTSAKKFLNSDGKEHVFVYNLTTQPDRYQLPEKNSIKKLIQEIGLKSNANDIIIIFFAGHGVMGEKDKQFYFLTADASSLSAGSTVNDVGISTNDLAEWLKPQNFKAQKRILILDACNSGQAIKDFVTLGNSAQGYIAARSDDKARQVKAIDKLNEKSGLFILAASASDQSAYEMSRYSQGLLTYSLLKAIKEEPGILQDGRYLDVSRWFNAAEKTVSDLTKDNAARQQPQIVSNTNFNIGVVDDDVLSKIILPLQKPLFSNCNLQNLDENIAMDDLGLNRLLDQELSDITQRGPESPIGFTAMTRADDAYSLNGRYEINGNKVIARVNISQFRTIKYRFEVEGTRDALAVLAEKIAAKAISLFR